MRATTTARVSAPTAAPTSNGRDHRLAPSIDRSPPRPDPGRRARRKRPSCPRYLCLLGGRTVNLPREHRAEKGVPAPATRTPSTGAPFGQATYPAVPGKDPGRSLPVMETQSVTRLLSLTSSRPPSSLAIESPAPRLKLRTKQTAQVLASSSARRAGQATRLIGASAAGARRASQRSPSRRLLRPRGCPGGGGCLGRRRGRRYRRAPGPDGSQGASRRKP